MRRLGFIFAILLYLAPLRASIERLQVEYLTNPIGIDTEQPRFSWQTVSNQRGVFQQAYQITVAEDENFTHVVWNSGRVDSDESVHIRYNGTALKPCTRYYWKVNTWYKDGKEEASTEKAFFETGLMDSGWSGAQWIQATHTPQKQGASSRDVDAQNPRFTLETDVTITSGNASVLFAIKDKSNLLMWSVNTLDDEKEPLIRHHVYLDGQCHTSDSRIGQYYSKSDLLNKKFRLKIEVQSGQVMTYINNVLVDTWKDDLNSLRYGSIGLRAFKGEHAETAIFDNMRLTEHASSKGSVRVDEDFEEGNRTFDSGTLVDVDGNSKLLVSSSQGDYRIFQLDNAGIPMFRKVFRAKRNIASARIYASALGVYDLFINGQRVGTPQPDGSLTYDELKPEWTDYRKTALYRCYDITSLLKPGKKNAIGAQVSSGWFMGDVSKGEYGVHELGFIAKMVISYDNGTSETIVTDPTWLSLFDGPVRMGEIYHGEVYDARKEANWTQPAYNDSRWNQTSVNPYFKGVLKSFCGPTVQVRPQLERQPQSITIYREATDRKINVVRTVDGSQAIRLKKGETAVYNMGQNMVGWVNFQVRGTAGTIMKFRFGEMLNDTGDPARGDDGPAGSIYTANLRTAKATLHYILRGDKKGETYHPSTTFFGFQYCEVTATDDIEITALKGEVIGSDTQEGSSFATSNASVNQLYSNILWGQRGNYLSVPTDCPQRDERLGWTGDTQVFCRAATYNADVASFFEKWMGDMRDAQRADGAYPAVAPTCWGCPHGQTAWADAGIIVPWTMYLVYNDKGILEENYASMEKYMEFLSHQEGDGFKYNGAGTAFCDWLSYEHTDNRYVSVCYYAYVAQLMEKISAALSTRGGDKYDLKAQHYRTLDQNIKKEFRQRYVDEQGNLRVKSQTAYLLALKLNLMPTPQDTEKARNALIDKITANGYRLSTGFVGTAILNQTLSQYNATDMAYNLLLQRDNPSWLYSVDQGATTIWERWDSYTREKGFNTVTMNSFNHYSYGAVGEWMYETMAGINADDQNPGYKHIVLCPQPDNRTALPEGQERITWVDATFQSVYGKIGSAWKKGEGNATTYRVSIPANTTATLVLQSPSPDCRVEEGQKPAHLAEGVTSVKYTKDRVTIELTSGDYEFVVRPNL